MSEEAESTEDGGGEPSYFLSDGVGGAGDAPDWFKGDKYKTVSDQAKAYGDAEKHIGEMRDKLGKFTGAPEAYEVELPEGVTMNAEDPAFTQAQEWAKSENLNQEGFNSLVNMYAQIEAAKERGFDEAAKEEMAQIDNFESRSENINDFLKANEMEALADVVTSKEQLEQIEKLLDMTGKSSLSGEGEPDAMPTQEDINALMFEKDEHGRQIYGYDKERQATVRKMFERRVGKGLHQQSVG